MMEIPAATLALAMVVAIAILAALALDLRAGGLLPAWRHPGTFRLGPRSVAGTRSALGLEETLAQAQVLQRDLQSLIGRGHGVADRLRRGVGEGDAKLVDPSASDGSGLRSRAERDLARALARRR